MDNYLIRKISYEDTKPFILNIHYAKRMPSITYSFGLFYKNELVGIVCYGSPASPTLAPSISGIKNKSLVIELNRLVLKYNKKNEASMLVGKSLKLLPKPKIIVSFADTNQGHSGYIYQATNFIYTGQSSNSYQWVDVNNKEFHFRNIGHYQKNNRINVGLVKRRLNEDKINKVEIANYLKKNKGTYTSKKIDKIFNYKDTAGHWFRTDKGFSFPNVDDWIKLKNILNFDNTYDDIMTNYKLVPDSKEIIKKLMLTKQPIKGKHRYIYIAANKKDKKKLFKELKHPISDYPKGTNTNYKTDNNINTQFTLL